MTRKELMEFWNISETRMKDMEAKGFTDIALYRISDVNTYLLVKKIKGLEKLKHSNKFSGEVVKKIPKGMISRPQLQRKLGISEMRFVAFEKNGLRTARYDKYLQYNENRYCILYDMNKVREWLKANRKGEFDDI